MKPLSSVAARAAIPVPEGEANLIARVRQGEVQAFEALFRAHAPALRDYATSYLGTSEAADNVVQDIFLRLWVRRAEWPVRGSLRAYLYSAARHQVLNVLRHGRAQQRWEPEIALHLSQDATDDITASQADLATLEHALTNAVAALPERQREVVRLRWVEGLAYTEVAQTLGISTKTVDNHLARALKTLRAVLGGGGDHR